MSGGSIERVVDELLEILSEMKSILLELQGMAKEKHLIAEKIRELESQDKTYSCNLCKREGLRENQVVWRGDDGWVCIYCAGLPEPFTASRI